MKMGIASKTHSHVSEAGACKHSYNIILLLLMYLACVIEGTSNQYK
jgi:hypothetical protein